MLHSSSFYFIINPASGSGKALPYWHKIKPTLAANFHFAFAITEYPRHAEILVRAAISAGYRKIIGVGGDGLFQEIGNGVLSQSDVEATAVLLGLIA